MDIKIPSGPGAGAPIDAIEEAAESTAGATEVNGTRETAESATTDPVSQIANQVATGELSRDQAIDQLLAHVLDLDMVKAAPAEATAELKETLLALLDTHPSLQSLSAFLGPRDAE
jgi:hypothetical protein